MHDHQKLKKTIIESAVKLPFNDLLLIQSQLSEHIFNLWQQHLIQQEMKLQEKEKASNASTVLN